MLKTYVMVINTIYKSRVCSSHIAHHAISLKGIGEGLIMVTGDVDRIPIFFR